MEHQLVFSFEHLFFFRRRFPLSILNSIFYHLLINLFPIFWLFLVLFRMLCMLLIVNEVCHVSSASRIIRNKFYANLLMFIEWFRTWSHASWIASDKTLARKLLAVLPKATMRRKKCGRKKQYRQLTAVSTLLSHTASVGFFFCTPFLFRTRFYLSIRFLSRLNLNLLSSSD